MVYVVEYVLVVYVFFGGVIFCCGYYFKCGVCIGYCEFEVVCVGFFEVVGILCFGFYDEVV